MIERTTSSVTDVTCRARVWIDWDLPASPIVNPRTSVTEQVAGNDCNIIEAPWLVHGGHGASLRHHKGIKSCAGQADSERVVLACVLGRHTSLGSRERIVLVRICRTKAGAHKAWPSWS
jgi:hypothetical protein